MQRFSPRIFLLFLSSVILTSGQSASAEDLRQLMEDIAVYQTYAEQDRQAMRIAKRLDQLTTSALEGSMTLNGAKEDLRAVLANEGRLKLGRDVHLFGISESDKILVLYNLPLTVSSRKVVLRIWRPAGEESTSNKGSLEPVEDTESEFGRISGYPVRDLYLLMRDDKAYVLLFGETGHGRGRRAISMWNIDKRKCVWVKEFAYGEECKVLIRKGQVTLKLELEEFGREVRKRTDLYGWENDKFQQLEKQKQ